MNDTDTNDRPKWLLELENRKRKPRLAHEAGAGSPCVICKTACPGLDLHFWRKICKNCKCSKDDHDVDDEDFPQFDLLFGTSRKYKKKSILLHINSGKEHAEEAFEWVPPDTTKELAADYMRALPTEKLPIKGTYGAAFRRQLLQKQLPLHDIDYKTCDKLSDQEMKQFEKYLENIKKYVGQGTVTKILSARPFNGSLVTPVNATDMQQFSPQNKPSVPSNFVQLRTPSSFAPKSSYKTNLYENANTQELSNSFDTSSNCSNIPIFEKYNRVNNDGKVVKSEAVKSGLYNKGVHPVDFSKSSSNNQNTKVPATEISKHSNDPAAANVNSEITSPWNPSEYYKEAYRDMLQNPSTSLSHSKPISDNVYDAEAMLADALLPPSVVHANDIIGSTLDEKGLMYIREKLTNKYSTQENQGKIPYNTPSFARSIDSNSLCRNNGSGLQNTSLPANSYKGTDKTVVPTAAKNPVGITPSQDTLQRLKGNIDDSEPAKTENETTKPNSNIVQSDPSNVTQIVDTSGTEKLSDTSLTSATVENPSSSPASSSHLQSPSVKNHQAKVNSFTTPSTLIHSERLQNQIFPHETLTAAKQSEQNPPNVEYLRNTMKELTVDVAKSQKCQKCGEEIRAGDVAVITEKAKDAVWHPGCFVCNMCNELLVDLVYFYYKNKLYCGRDLAKLLGIPRCFACDELIFVREYTVAEGQNYHVKHFCCWDCDVPLAGKQYITENDRPLCLPCYQKTYAKTCNTCENVIAADQQGVAVKDLNFHATGACFCCYICNKSLLDGKFALKEKKIFCSKECISKFLHPQVLIPD
ncbi:Prickle-like protein 2 [Anthophora retusa]